MAIWVTAIVTSQTAESFMHESIELVHWTQRLRSEELEVHVTPLNMNGFSSVMYGIRPNELTELNKHFVNDAILLVRKSAEQKLFLSKKLNVPQIS